MGRRAKKAPVVTKKRPTLARRFKCPFCASENCVECTMNLRAGTGSLACRLCGASFQMPIHHLHEPIDVFSEWLDACEAAERSQQQDAPGGMDRGIGQQRTQGTDYYDDDEDDDDDLGEASGFSRKPSSTSNKSSSKSGENKGQKDTENQERPRSKKQSYASLGLGDSDDESE